MAKDDLTADGWYDVRVAQASDVPQMAERIRRRELAPERLVLVATRDLDSEPMGRRGLGDVTIALPISPARCKRFEQGNRAMARVLFRELEAAYRRFYEGARK